MRKLFPQSIQAGELLTPHSFSRANFRKGEMQFGGKVCCVQSSAVGFNLACRSLQECMRTFAIHDGDIKFVCTRNERLCIRPRGKCYEGVSLRVYKHLFVPNEQLNPLVHTECWKCH